MRGNQTSGEIDALDATPVAKKCMEEGLLINCTQKNILRIMPPLVVTKEDILNAMKILEKALEIL